MASKHLDHLRALTQKLEKSSQELELFFELSLDMLLVMDTGGQIIRVNESWTEALGWSIEELESQRYLDLIHPRDKEATTQELREIVEENKRTYYFRNRVACKDGSYKVLCWTARLNKNSTMIYGVARDFSRMMEQKDD